MHEDIQVKLDAIVALKKEGYYVTNLVSFDNKEPNYIYSQKYDEFKDSWNNLKLDNYMSDGGRYRYRRYSVVICYNCNELKYLPLEPHFQNETYNNLNGGVYRYYKSFKKNILEGFILKIIVNQCCSIFNNIICKNLNWRVECHQFRIISSSTQLASPTPEGKHRDGVDYVFIALIKRENIVGGMTKIYDNDNSCLFRRILQDQECIILDDFKVMHEVLSISSLSSKELAYRDALVLTFKKI